jgi:hypothetical protein
MTGGQGLGRATDMSLPLHWFSCSLSSFIPSLGRVFRPTLPLRGDRAAGQRAAQPMLL